MKLAASISLAAALAASAMTVPQFEQFAVDSGLALSGLNGLALLKTASRYSGSCNPSTVKVRQEWRTLSKDQRRNYIAAVKCVQSTASILDPGQAPGSKSLFEDFVYVHMNATPFIHFTGNFLTWHRYFIHQYELRLQACGYKGVLPYWEWGLDVASPHDSPVFDGSDTSLGGDGEFIPGHQGATINIPGGSTIQLAPGTGGGCVVTGPFANMTTHLGPGTLPHPTQDNPRCLKRDLNADCARRFTTFRNTTELILQSATIESFQTTMQGDPRYVANSLGVHGGAHFIIGGDPGGDVFVSPGDPAFFALHTQVDRIYWTWQMLDFDNRQGVFGTNTLMDRPPSANTTVDDYVWVSPLGPPAQIKDLMNTVGGTPFCYVYI